MKTLIFLATFASVTLYLPNAGQTVLGAATTTARVGDTVRVGLPYFPDAPAMLAKGFRPPSVVPQHLIFYAPLDGRYQDLRGGHTLTPYNSPVNADDHPRMR